MNPSDLMNTSQDYLNSGWLVQDLKTPPCTCSRLLRDCLWFCKTFLVWLSILKYFQLKFFLCWRSSCHHCPPRRAGMDWNSSVTGRYCKNYVSDRGIGWRSRKFMHVSTTCKQHTSRNRKLGYLGTAVRTHRQGQNIACENKNELCKIPLKNIEIFHNPIWAKFQIKLYM